MNPLDRIEKATYSGQIEVRASALLYLLGMLDGLLKGDADTAEVVAMLLGREPE